MSAERFELYPTLAIFDAIRDGTMSKEEFSFWMDYVHDRVVEMVEDQLIQNFRMIRNKVGHERI